MKLTTREKVMIGVLVLVLLASVFVLLLRSYSNKIDEKQAELDGLRSTADSLRSAVAGVERMEKEIPALKESTKSLKQQFYSIQKNRQFDKTVTALADACGLEPISLTVSDSESGQIKSYISVEGGAGEEEQPGGYIWSNTAEFTAEGTEEELYAFLDAVAADPALRVSGLSFETPARANGVTEFDISLVMYMYDKDGTA